MKNSKKKVKKLSLAELYEASWPAVKITSVKNTTIKKNFKDESPGDARWGEKI